MIDRDIIPGQPGRSYKSHNLDTGLFPLFPNPDSYVCGDFTNKWNKVQTIVHANQWRQFFTVV